MSKLEPNLNKLISRKIAKDAIADGSGVQAGMDFLTDPAQLTESFKKAVKWARGAIRAIREADDPNPWRKANDDTIAAEILKRIEERKKGS